MDNMLSLLYVVINVPGIRRRIYYLCFFLFRDIYMGSLMFLLYGENIVPYSRN